MEAKREVLCGSVYSQTAVFGVGVLIRAICQRSRGLGFAGKRLPAAVCRWERSHSGFVTRVSRT